MTITELGAIGELVGGVAVIASLIFVGLQVRQSNHLAISRSHEESSRASSDLAFVFSEPRSTELFVRAHQGWDRLSPNEVLRLRALIQAAMNYFETLFYAHLRGEVHPEVWESRLARMRAYREIGFERIWESLETFYGESFRVFVNREVLGGTPTPQPYRELLRAGSTGEG